MEHFPTPYAIRRYGFMINSLSEVAKHLAELMDHMGYQEAEIKKLVGIGPFNSLGDKKDDFIHYGPYITETPSGLFGAFASVHFPEIALANRIPGILGARGFKLVYQDQGSTASWPLQDVAFSFIPRIRSTPTADGTCGRITLAHALTYGDVTLAAATPLTQLGRNAKKSARKMEPEFSIVDANGVRMNDPNATAMLWLHITAVTGLKKHGLQTAEFETIAADGPDDDFAAQAEMIDLLRGIQHNHRIDLMPEFNALTQRAGAILNKKPDMLESLALALAIANKIEEQLAAHNFVRPKYLHYIRRSQELGEPSNLLEQIVDYNEHFKLLAPAIDLKLPEMSPATPLLQDINRFTSDLMEAVHVEDWNKNVEWLTVFQASHMRPLSAFSENWGQGRANRGMTGFSEHYYIATLDEGILQEALPLLSAKLRQRAIATANDALAIMEKAMLRNESRFAEQAEAHPLHLPCANAREALAAVRQKLNEANAGDAPVTQEVALITQAFRSLKNEKSSSKRTFLHEHEETRFKAFLDLMRVVKCDLKTLANLYGDTTNIETSWNEGRNKVPHMKLDAKVAELAA